MNSKWRLRTILTGKVSPRRFNSGVFSVELIRSCLLESDFEVEGSTALALSIRTLVKVKAGTQSLLTFLCYVSCFIVPHFNYCSESSGITGVKEVPANLRKSMNEQFSLLPVTSQPCTKLCLNN